MQIFLNAVYIIIAMQINLIIGYIVLALVGKDDKCPENAIEGIGTAFFWPVLIIKAIASRKSEHSTHISLDQSTHISDDFVRKLIKLINKEVEQASK